ncbi:TRAM domain-containing protein, partial [Muribaculum intestinale]
MSRKRKELPVLEHIEIADVAAEGNALARVDGLVVFVPFAAPGDIADIKLLKKRKSYADGRIERLITPG